MLDSRIQPNCRRVRLSLALLCLGLFAMGTDAAQVRIAVASNFADAARKIGEAFTHSTGYEASLSIGSTGKLYAQIAQGAPFDVFLAADQQRPALSVSQGLAIADSRVTYATGRIVLFSPDAQLINGEQTLRAAKFTRLAIANPAIAPYGKAAESVLRRLDLYQVLAARLVRGSNIAQTYQFVATGNAELGFVAASQLAHKPPGSYWQVPHHLYDPIAQDAVLLQRAGGNSAARAFMRFLQGPEAQTILERFGYTHTQEARGK